MARQPQPKLHVGGKNVTDLTNAFYLQYGRTVDAWASLERCLADCFRVLSGTTIAMSDAIFCSGRSFQTRRDLMLAAIPNSALDRDVLDFLAAAVRKAAEYSKARNQIAHRLISYNAATEQAEMREGHDRDLHSSNITTFDDLSNMEKHFTVLEDIIFDVMFAAPQERASQCQQGIARVRALPSQAHSQSQAKTTRDRPLVLVRASPPRDSGPPA
jgi:hypothetical protein